MDARPYDEDLRVRCNPDCRNYSRSDGACAPARKGERKDVTTYYHPVADIPRCCEFFVPQPDAEEQRSARERWPNLCREYDEIYGKKKSVRERIDEVKAIVA